MSSSGPEPNHPSAPPAGPLVSVILPTHNRAKLLVRAIQSVLGQTYRNLELIVVDDASTDETEATVRGFADPRLRYIRLEKNSRAAAARNVGINASRGELLAFQDDDDEWLPHKLERQVPALLNAPPDVGLNLCGFTRKDVAWGEQYFGGEERLRALRFDQVPYWGGDYSLLSTPNWLLRRSVIDRAGLFDERLKSLDDWEWAIRILDTCRFEHLDESLWIQHRGAAPNGMVLNPRLLIDDYPLLIEKYEKRLKPEMLAQFCMQLGALLLLERNPECVRWFRRALRYNPRLWKAWALSGISLLGMGAMAAILKSGDKQGAVPPLVEMSAQRTDLGPSAKPSSGASIESGPLVSVIMPTHNRSRLIGRAIRSVLGQSYRNLELIVVDDASTDDTPSVVKAIDDPRLRYIRLDKNVRAAAARNVGIKAAQGELLAFQDDDDEWLPQKLERQVPLLLQAPEEVGVHVTGFRRIAPWGVQYIGGEAEARKLDFNQCPGRVDFALISTPNLLLRKSVLDRAGLFDERLKSLDDFELCLRILDHCRLQQLDEALWIQHWALPKEAVMARNPRLIVHDYALLMDMYAHRWKPSTLAQYSYQAALIETWEGRSAEATRWFKRAFRYQPSSPKHLVLLVASFAGHRAVKAVLSVRYKVRTIIGAMARFAQWLVRSASGRADMSNG